MDKTILNQKLVLNNFDILNDSVFNKLKVKILTQTNPNSKDTLF